MTAIKDLIPFLNVEKNCLPRFENHRREKGYYLLLSLGKFLRRRILLKTSYDDGISVELNTPLTLPSLHLVSILPNYESYRFEFKSKKLVLIMVFSPLIPISKRRKTLQFVAIYDGERFWDGVS